MADPLHRLSQTAEDLHVVIPCRNRTLLLQRGFCISLYDYFGQPIELTIDPDLGEGASDFELTR
jgi:hypothetical protein